mmetsp:Transcript_38503/g.28348  ORF Transcript_38503/g.28348 Transcript_38503/m.28348 type:complete len:114 (+) Transcript_38503:456-797(+)
MRSIEGEMRDFMRPSNILVHGRSGSGKTEIFRIIAKVYNAPFIKVEATKYTEVGYHGEDVTNIVVDLFKKTKQEILKRDGQELFSKSKIIHEMIRNYVMRMVLGLNFKQHPSY